MTSDLRVLPLAEATPSPRLVLARLAAQARTEGYDHVDRLAAEWDAGCPGSRAVLCVAAAGETAAVGALTEDPYEAATDLLRVRRVYVDPTWRGRGVGRMLARALVAAAPPDIRRLALRAPDERAAAFWESQGFVPDGGRDRTHLLRLGR